MKRLILFGLLLGAMLGCQDKVELTSNQSDLIYIRHEGADMPVHVHGNAASKKFILLVHGGPGGSGLEYRSGEFSESLEAEYAVGYWDQRGQGMSQGHYGTELVNVDQMAKDLHAVAQGLRFHYGTDISIYVFGHSWGGMLGTAYASSGFQSEVQGWIEVSGAHDIPQLNRAAIRMYLEIGQDQIDKNKNVDFWREVIDFAAGVDTNNISIDDGGRINSYGFQAEQKLDEVTPGTGAYSPLKELFFSPRNLLTAGVGGSITANQLQAEVETKSLTSQLPNIQIPTLLIYGKYDFVVPAALGETAFREIGTADKEYVLFENSGHSPMDNEPTLFVNTVIDWVNRH